MLRGEDERVVGAPCAQRFVQGGEWCHTVLRFCITSPASPPRRCHLHRRRFAVMVLELWSSGTSAQLRVARSESGRLPRWARSNPLRGTLS